MKKTIFFSMLLLCFIFIEATAEQISFQEKEFLKDGSDPAINSPRSGNLVAHWPLDGDFLDASGNGNHAIVNGDGLVFVDGILGQGVTGFPTQSFLTLPNLNLTTATLSAWVYAYDNSGFQKFFRSAGPGLCIGIYEGFWEPCGGTQIAPIEENSWHHFAIVDGDGLYVNGVKITGLFGGLNPSIADITFVGGPPFSEWFNGIIDDIRWYDYALSAGEVAALYYMTNDPRCQGIVGLVGEFNGWGSDPDVALTQTDNPDIRTGYITLSTANSLYGDPNIIEVKFRLNSNWNINWGASDFPSGISYQEGPNIPVPVNPDGTPVTYFVTFNCSTGEYSFIVSDPSRCDGIVSLVGEFNNWGNSGPDLILTQSLADEYIWTGQITLSTLDNLYDDPNIIEVKFRLNSDWAINWGSLQFPYGIGFQGGPNIPVPVNTDDTPVTYFITINCSTGEYSFVEIQSIPVSNWALYLGILLMITFVVIRFRRII
jgi:hypothetical protein